MLARARRSRHRSRVLRRRRGGHRGRRRRARPAPTTTPAGSIRCRSARVRARSARRVTWGSLDLYFGDESRYAAGTPHFYGYSYGDVNGVRGRAGRAWRRPRASASGRRSPFLVAAYPGGVADRRRGGHPGADVLRRRRRSAASLTDVDRRRRRDADHRRGGVRRVIALAALRLARRARVGPRRHQRSGRRVGARRAPLAVLRGRPLWADRRRPAAPFAQAITARSSMSRVRPRSAARLHALYGFSAVIAVGILYSYRTSSWMRGKEYLLYGAGLPVHHAPRARARPSRPLERRGARCQAPSADRSPTRGQAVAGRDSSGVDGVDERRRDVVAEPGVVLADLRAPRRASRRRRPTSSSSRSSSVDVEAVGVERVAASAAGRSASRPRRRRRRPARTPTSAPGCSRRSPATGSGRRRRGGTS